MSKELISPHMLPLPHNASFQSLPLLAPFGTAMSRSPERQAGEEPAEMTATAALMMMGSDRRGKGNAGGRGGGMSVHDLLSH